MNTKEYLNSAYIQNRSIQRKKERLETLRELATATTPAASGMPHADSPEQQRIAGVVDQIVDLENEIADDEKKLLETRAHIADVISGIKDDMQLRILMKRYLEYASWENIGAAVGTSKRWAIQLHKQAIAKIEKNLHSSLPNHLHFTY